MFARRSLFSSIGRTAVMATVAAMALTAVEPSLAARRIGAGRQGVSTAAATSGATDFSARRRYYRGGGGAAAAGAFAAIVGTGLAIAATQNRRAYYDDYYGGGPGLLWRWAGLLRRGPLLRRARLSGYGYGG